MVKLVTKKEKVENKIPKPVTVNLTLSVSTTVDIRNGIEEYFYEKFQDKTDKDPWDEGYSEKAEEFTNKRMKNLTEQDLLEYYQYCYDDELWELANHVLENATENEIDISATFSKPLESIVNND